MSNSDDSFSNSRNLALALELLSNAGTDIVALPDSMPEHGLGEVAALESLAPHVLGKAARLDAPTALAHMDPPTPWITWATALWNARLNQNLLHPGTAPFALEAEQRVIGWLAPYFGMEGGHMCSGSTLSNLTALWAARDAGGARSVVASDAAHLSIEKAARILGMPYRSVPVDRRGQMVGAEIVSTKTGDVSDACLVLTAGTTSTGAVDDLDLAGRAAWTHVDAAWAGPLRLSDKYGERLNGIGKADSIAVSAHKWLFQPKESAIVLFRDEARASAALSLDGSYLSTPNVGVQGSRGAAAVPLLATLLAWGKAGMARRIDRTMAISETLADVIENDSRLELLAPPETGINVFRPLDRPADALLEKLPEGTFSTLRWDDRSWLRSVAANPLADVGAIAAALRAALDSSPADGATRGV